jgi:hypothetical protein
MENDVRRLLRERVGQVPPCGVISLDCDYRDAEQGAHVRSSLAFRKRALAVVVVRYETTATARLALLFIVGAFFNDTITVAVWTGFHVRLMGIPPRLYSFVLR